jgi:hypothetical protein
VSVSVERAILNGRQTEALLAHDQHARKPLAATFPTLE